MRDLWDGALTAAQRKRLQARARVLQHEARAVAQQRRLRRRAGVARALACAPSRHREAIGYKIGYAKLSGTKSRKKKGIRADTDENE